MSSIVFEFGGRKTSLKKSDWIIWDPITKCVHFMREKKESPCFEELFIVDSAESQLSQTVDMCEEFDKIAREIAAKHNFRAAGIAYSLVGRDDVKEYRFQ